MATFSTGPLLLGYLFNWCLYGILLVQVYLYYLAFPKDRLATKCLVFGLFLVETLQTSFVVHDAFDRFGSGFGNLAVFRNNQLEWLGVPIITGIVSCAVQTFFAYRIFILSKSKLLWSMICVIALSQCGAAITQGVQALQVREFSKLQAEAFISCAIWLVGAAVCDIIIAISMSYYLWKSETGFNSTHALFTRLIWLTIGTGSMTAVVETVAIVLFFAFPHNSYYQTPALVLAKLYSNTLLVVFNSRLRIINGRDATQSIGLTSFSSPRKDRITRNNQMGQSQPKRDGTRQIEVDTVLAIQKKDWESGAYTG
ncbi:hypothetical protein BD779DRAFT_1673302 [Infundibulicybe gibba]|nr:hypothetical protein BD779DRAFT_1673302 [Infundibulicybe gibba]